MDNTMYVRVTGITGFVGTNLLSFSRTGFQISGIGRELLPDIDKLAEFLDVQNTDAVIHLAGKAHDLKHASKQDIAEYYYVNTELTKIVYNAFLQSDVSVFIYMSSIKATGEKSSVPITEDVVTAPKTDYGKSKLLAEQFIQQNDRPGKRVYILRPCMIHGEGNKGNLNLLFQMIRKRIPYPLKAFKNKRSFLSVENLCFVISEFLSREDIPSGIYNIADDIPLSTNRVVEIIGESMDVKPIMWAVNKNIIRFIARIGDILKLSFTNERLEKLTENYVVSNAKLLSALKKDLPVSSEQGLRTTFKSFRKG